MTTIDTNMSLVMIDPNEPLELYDGTIIKGRLEWFLYALCCLDYGNLPTPLSRIEEWANALITNQLPNMEPQSRAEEFFKAILTGDTSNLPTPQSRSEVLLDKLARGENDFTNVEKIQSRYEFLLAYLIKNGGGIGNIDYVLYKFQKEDETLYNTKERPVKSAILKGQTLVNVDSYYRASDFWYSNIANLSDDGYITINATGGWVNSFTKVSSLIKPNTKYLVIYEIKQNSLNGIFTLLSQHDKSSVFTLRRYPNINPGQTGIFKYIVTTDATFDSDKTKICLRNFLNAESTTGSLVYRSMVFEYIEGMENWDIPFFRGMQSVKMPVLQTVGKNLFDGKLELGGIDHNTGALATSKTTKRNVDYITVKPNTQLSFSVNSGESGINWFFYDVNENYISNTFARTVTSPPNAHYLRFYNLVGDIPLNDYQIMIAESTAPVTYEPYKTNILTTTSKNLFDVNRPYDNLTDSQATVVQDTNQITVSSAESGTYVNANFILDKDFFAGKTVTGSCLYESDEKDIGTVQIVYQDGNGEHHYQWIRTPRTFTFPNSFIGDVMLSVYANNTDTPQSNTVTVKNIQLELGSTATPYEPYSEEVTLRGIGDVKDELDCLTGEVTERIGEIVLDSSNVERWRTYEAKGEYSVGKFTLPLNALSNGGAIPSTNVKCDKINVGTTNQEGSQEQISIYYHSVNRNYCELRLCLLTSKLTSADIEGIRTYVQNNPFAVQYQLAEKSIKTVDLTITDQGGATIPKLNTFDKITHVNVSATDILPEVEMEVATTVGEDLSGSLYSTMEDIETKQEALKESNNDQTESINSTMMATTEIYESLL